MALLHFLWQGAINRRDLCRRTKVERTHLRPERPLLSRLCRTYGDGDCSSGDLDAACAGQRRNPLPPPSRRRCPPPGHEPARFVSLPLFGDVYAAPYPGRFCPGWWRSGLPVPPAFSLRLLGAWILAERLRSTEWCALRLPNGSGPSIGSKTRIAVSRPVRLLVSGLLQAPAAIGWLRPMVLVPAGALAGLPAAQIEALLLHELAHIRRHDYLVHILQSVFEAVFFYHPAVWWISGHMRSERELCCDDIAVSITGDAVIYARALAEFDSARWIRPTVVAANGGSLADRIARLLGHPPTSHRAARRSGNRAYTDPVGNRGVGSICPTHRSGRSLK